MTEHELTLRAFVRELLDYISDDCGMDIPGCDIEEMLEKHGLLVRNEFTVPCADWCACAEVLDTGEKAECYRTVPWLVRDADTAATVQPPAPPASDARTAPEANGCAEQSAAWNRRWATDVTKRDAQIADLRALLSDLRDAIIEGDNFAYRAGPLRTRLDDALDGPPAAPASVAPSGADKYDALWNMALSLGALAGRAYNAACAMPDGKGEQWRADFEATRGAFLKLPVYLRPAVQPGEGQ